MRAKTLWTMLLTSGALLDASLVCGQDKAETAPKPVHKNIVRYNLSSALLFGANKCVIFGYERVVQPQQSFSVNAGTIALPKLIVFSTDSFKFERNTKRTGFNVSADYRFYLAKENKYPAPRGVYIGPFYSYNGFKTTNSWTVRNGTPGNEVATDTKFQIHTIGAELGYQFIIWDRIAIDLVLVGPGISAYKFETKITGSVTGESLSDLQKAAWEAIKERFPAMNTVLQDKEAEKDGVTSTWNLGYRYLIHVGYNF